MPQYIKSEFGAELALSILNEIQYQRYNYYSFLGKCDPWGLGDEAPITPQTNSIIDYKKIRNNIVYLKRITSNDVSMVIRKIVWEPKTFIQWDDTIEMATLDFYCVTDDWNVYKCLNNNNGAISTIKPTDTGNVAYLPLADGYVWKYMYTIPSFKTIKFTTSNYMPVQLALSDSFYNKGSVENVVITNPGAGYINTPLVTLNVSAPAIGGTQAILIPSISTTPLYDASGVNIIRPAGSFVKVTIVDQGSNYLTVPTITITENTPTGSGIYGDPVNAQAKLTAVIHNGMIVNVLIEDPGQAYSADTSSLIVATGDGTGASFTPVIYSGDGGNGELIDVITENVGTGYNYMNLSLVSGSGSGAELQAIIGISDYQSNQTLVEQTAGAAAGSIYLAIVESGGTNYQNNISAVVTATGDGTDFAAEAEITQGGSVSKINITNFGVDYTYINITVTDQNTGASNAVIRAVLPPPLGHGADAIIELCSNTVAINSFIQKDTILNKFNQDYRQLGLIKNPKSVVTNTIYRNTTANMCFEVTLNTVDGLLTEYISGDYEDILTIDGSRFRVISSEGNKVYLLQLDNKYTLPIGTMICERTGLPYESLQIISSPPVDKNSGKLLYVSEENPFSFGNNQGLNVKTFLKF